MSSYFIITNARLVTPDGVMPEASLKVEQGTITAISNNSLRGSHQIDAGGNYLLPGFIDIHSDAIEKGIEPRPNTFFPVDIAVSELDKKLAACGITTMFHSLSFAEMEIGLRSNGTASKIIREIHQFRQHLKIHTRIHARFEVTDLEAVPFLEELIEERLIDLFSFMDHSPGQGQFRDIMAFKSYYGPVYGKSDAEMDGIIDRKQKTRETSSRDMVHKLVRLCHEQGIAISSHDDDSQEKINWLKEMEIGLTEFPVNLKAVKAAHEQGIKICLGSPNVVRGKSQAGNLSVRDAIAQGYGDILCSDYAPMTMLHAVMTLERLGILPLHEAVRMVSLHPAEAVGIADRTGSLEEGKDADMVLIEQAGSVPRILKTFVRGREVFATC